MESPLVTAFLILLRLLNFPIPDVPSDDLHGLFDQIAHAIHLQNYVTDIFMDQNLPSFNGNLENSFDFIIVGGGTAGCLIAGRLAEKYKVLVLEAGAEPTILSSIPMFNMLQWTSSDTMWGYHSVPQFDHCFACKERKVKYIQGKSLGGTMNLAHSIYSRGSVFDYMAWENATNDSSWNYDGMSKHWMKLESYKGVYDDSMTHGFHGEMKITSQQFQPLVNEWIDSGNSTGYLDGDYNEPMHQGFSSVETTIFDGRRDTTYTNFLKKETWRRNLRIIRYAHVQKIVFEDNIARGVIYSRAGKEIEVRCTKEVILTAGVFNTPKLLMLSGIGPEYHLQNMNIEVKVAMEHVGQNLQDQPCTLFGPIAVDTMQSFMMSRNLTFSSIFEYKLNQSGPLTSNLISGMAYISTPGVEKDYPNIQLMLIPTGVDSESYKTINAAFDLKEGYMARYLKEYKDNDAVWCSVCLVRTKSRGSVELMDDNWESDPVIDSKFYDIHQDMVDIVHGIHFAQLLFKTKPWSRVEAKITSTLFPGCESHEPKSPTYYECLANHLTYSSGSIGGTCRMGMSASDSVVNEKLQVHELKRLRIADASVMPLLPNGMAGTVVLAIAEKVSDLLLSKWNMVTDRQRDLSDDALP